MTLQSEVIDSPRVPRIGPYSQAIRVGDLVYTAGQPGIDPKTGQVAGESFEAQARQAFANLRAVLEDAGSSLERIVPGLFVQAMYSYAFVEEVLNIHHDRSNGALEVGYFITPSIGVRFLASGFYTHGGRVILSPADYHCANPNACTAADPLFLHHDQIGHASAISLGGGLSYALTGSVDVYATYLRTVQGRGGHKLDHGLALGFSWGFSPKQVIRRMFGPRTPVGGDNAGAVKASP